MEQNVLNTDLTGKVAVVTGASGTLCSIFAKALARAGAKVALLGRNMEKLKALADEIEAEGGIAARGARYARMNSRLRSGMAELGFTAYIAPEHQGPIITTFFYPSEDFDFKSLYAYLKQNGYVIYPGKLTDRDTFRLGNIGEIYDEDVDRILAIFRAYVEAHRAAR